MELRRAVPGEWSSVMTVLDGGLLETDAGRVRDAIDDEDVLVAVENGRVLGALVMSRSDGSMSSVHPRDVGATCIEAVAVRRGRRGQGIGTALVEEAADRRGRLVAGFDGRVLSFWTSLGFDIESAVDPDRYVGTHRGRDGG